MDAYKTKGKALSRFEQDRDMTLLKRELTWLHEVDATALQSSLRDLDNAYQNFFRRVKQGGAPGFPHFKSKHNHRKSYKSKRVGNNIAVRDDTVKLPKLGLVRCAVSKQVEGRILSATVSQNPSGKYFVSVCCTDVEISQYEGTGAAIGLDMGLKDFAITSDGQTFENHRHLKQSEKKLAKLQHQLSRKSKGSNNRNKARTKVARQHERIANQRNDTLHKLSTQLVKDYDVICVETLRPKNMIKNHRLAKSISDASWGEFVRQLEYKCEWQHKPLVKIDPFFPSSQTCHVCGNKNPGTKDLGVRAWVCSECGAEHDRDVNAAKNILSEGLRLLA
jgi:putative transposase